MGNHVPVGILTKAYGWSRIVASDLSEKKARRFVPVVTQKVFAHFLPRRMFALSSPCRSATMFGLAEVVRLGVKGTPGGPSLALARRLRSWFELFMYNKSKVSVS